MNTVMKFELCCGCGHCAEICPQNAIIMAKSKEGFFYPSINNKECINCGKCSKSCSFNTRLINQIDCSVIESYAIKHCNEKIREKSRSGGAFTAISDWVLKQNGVVYGCELVDFRIAIHRRAVNGVERDQFRGSKYIQSEIHHCYKLIKNDLLKNKWVLFSGTPCQVDAVKSFCNDIDTKKLLLVDIVCHGVPSPKVWNDYLDLLLKQKKGKTLKSVDFRDKKRFGWTDSKETICFSDGEIYSSTVFSQLFYSHLILRKDCFHCPYKNLNRVGDITIADCWGITEKHPEFDDNKGVSLVLINSKKGKNIWNDINSVRGIKVDVNDYKQAPLEFNWNPPSAYQQFWKYYSHHSLKKVINKYVYHIDSRLYVLINRYFNLIKELSMVLIKKVKMIK